MKVLHVNSEPGLRGGERQLLNLLQGLNGYNIENFVACRQNSAIENYCKELQIPYISLPFKGSIDLQTIKGIIGRCHHWEIDIIHAHTAKAHGLVAIASLWLPNILFIVHRRVIFPIRQNIFTQWKFNRPTLQKVLCVSKAIEHEVKSSIKRPDLTETIYSAVDIKRLAVIEKSGKLRALLKLPEDCTLVGCAAALTEEKAVEVFIHTIKVINEKHNATVYGVVLGEGKERQSLEALIQSLQMDEVIFLPGFQNDVHELLPDLDIYLASPAAEGLGTSIIDAQALGLPVVATAVGGVPEIVIHNSTGMLAPAGDYALLAEHCIKLIGDKNLAAQLINNAKTHLEKFSLQHMCQCTFEVYNEVNKKSH